MIRDQTERLGVEVQASAFARFGARFGGCVSASERAAVRPPGLVASVVLLRGAPGHSEGVPDLEPCGSCCPQRRHVLGHACLAPFDFQLVGPDSLQKFSLFEGLVRVG